MSADFLITAPIAAVGAVGWLRAFRLARQLRREQAACAAAITCWRRAVDQVNALTAERERTPRVRLVTIPSPTGIFNLRDRMN